MSESNPEAMVRYCPECGCIGPVKPPALTCCPDSCGMSVRRWQAEKLERMLERPRVRGVAVLGEPSTAGDIVRLACKWYDTGWGKPDAAHELELAVLRHKQVTTGVEACGSNGTADCQSTPAAQRCAACLHGETPCAGSCCDCGKGCTTDGVDLPDGGQRP